MLPKKRQLAYRMINVKPIDAGIFSRLPEAYKKFHRERFEQLPKPVHYIPDERKFVRNPETGVVTPIQNVPISTRFPPQMNQVLSGGDMVVQGFVKKHPRKRRVPRFWIPQLFRSVVYSEILNKHISAIVTRRLIEQVHEHKGFDNYLLKNAACDIRSSLGLKIKKRILEVLSEKNLPYDGKTNNDLYEKYKRYIIPKDELEWYGLTPVQAMKKQAEIEERERTNVVPMKHKFRAELLEELRNTKLSDIPIETEESEKGWLSKIKGPFRRK